MKHVPKIKWLLIFAVQWAVYARLFGYIFAYIEQTHLFLFTASYAAETIFRAGGLSAYLSEFLIQFFIMPYAGAAVTAALTTLAAMLSQAVLCRISAAGRSCLLYFVPALALMVLHFDFNYFVQGTVAFIFALLCVWLYGKARGALRLAAGCAFPIALFLAAGSVFALFAALAVLYDVFTKRFRPAYAVAYLAAAAAACFLGMYFSLAPSLRMAVSPESYFTPGVSAHKVFYPWAAIALAMAIAYMLRGKEASPKRLYLWVGMQWCLVIMAGFAGVKRYGGLKSAAYKKMDYFVRMRDWESVVLSFDGKDVSRQRMAMVNLALAEQELLDARLLDFPQKGIGSLMPAWDRTVYSASLLSDIYYCMGLPSLSQKFAFEALAASDNRNPRSLERLIETNIITGAYPVAEKYINILEHSLFHKDFASSRRKYLYDDAEVEQDKALSLKRRCWQAEKTMAEAYSDPVSALWHIMPMAPENAAGMAYLTSFLLLNKDIGNYHELLDSIYRTQAWRKLSSCQQEAVVIINPDDPRFWLRYGVSAKTRNRAIEFMNAVTANARRKDIAETLAPEYGNTYWFYYMFNKE